MTAKPKTKAAPKDDLTRPAKFSLEALLAGRVNPVKTHRVTIDPDTAARIQALHDEKDQLQTADAQIEGLTPSRRRMAAKDDRAERTRQIDAEIAELLPTLDGTWVQIQFRPLTALEQDDIRAANLKAGAAVAALMWEKCAKVRADDSDDEDDWAEQTAAEWDRFIEVIGIPQFTVLDQILGSLTYGGRVVTPDFFVPSSRSQPTAGS